MQHNQDKRYYEHLAKLLLETFIPNKYQNLIHSDRPDLRVGNNYGVEVTRVFYPNDAKAAGIFKHLKNRKINDIDERHLETFRKLNHRLFITPDNVIRGYFPCEAILENTDGLKTEYLKKIENYSHSPLKTPRNDLFLYAPSYDFGADLVDGFFQWVCEIQNCPFEFLIVFDFVQLYFFNFNTRNLRIISVEKESKEKLHQCCVMAKSYSAK